MPSTALERLAAPYSESPSTGDYKEIKSPRLGGICRVIGSAEASLERISKDERILLRRMIWETTHLGSTFVLRSEHVDTINDFAEPSFEQKSTDLLRTLFNRSEILGETIWIESEHRNTQHLRLEAQTIVCSERDDEVRFFLNYLAAREFIHRHVGSAGESVSVMPTGVVFLENLSRARTESSQCFVAMWFHGSMEDAWLRGFRPGIAAAGYTAFRIGERPHQNRIDDEIMAQIRLSRFVIADFTCQPGRVRGGVYFEAGFALGLGLPVFWSVRKDRLKSLHFDTRQYPHLVWSDPSDLQARLTDQIVAHLGKGPIGAVPQQPPSGRSSP